LFIYNGKNELYLGSSKTRRLKMKAIFITFILLLSFTEIYSQNFWQQTNTLQIDTNVFKYYPLNIGNSWTYLHYSPFPGFYRYKKKVTGTIILEGKSYYVITTYRTGYTDYLEYLRIDSTCGNVRNYTTTGGCSWTPNERVGDSLAARRNDSSKYNCTFYFRCANDTLHYNFNGLINVSKTFFWTDYFEHVTTRLYLKGIGMVYDHQAGHSPTIIDLLGCVINGIKYGDTNLVGISPLSSEMPDRFSLYQNYPNPFNPSTKIRFDFPTSVKRQTSNVKLVIYDVLGREVTTLVNEQLKHGKYEVIWDASNYTSGVYFYRLVADDYIESKKMILIK
jgi:hypothetical protein